MEHTKGDRVEVIDEHLARKVICNVSNGDLGTINKNYGDGFVEVVWDNARYPHWDIQVEALAKAEGK